MASPAPVLRYAVALAGSAGALPTILRQVDRLFVRDGSSLFVAWHRPPDAPFALERVVPDDIAFEVCRAEDGAPVRPNVIYYPRAADDLAVADGRLVVSPPRGRYRPSLDNLFTSLAREYGERVIAVLLSGGGTDGVRGLAEVRSRGGLSIAQDPSVAKVANLPRAAVSAHVVDHVLSTGEILTLVDRALSGGTVNPDRQ